MQGKVLQFGKSADVYIKTAKNYAKNGEYIRAIAMLQTALKIEYSLSTLEEIASVYANAGYYERSNQYWFYYLQISPKDLAHVAYDGLSSNYFALGNVLASGYYLNKNLGQGENANLDSVNMDIVDYFSSKLTEENRYYIAYPFDRADYSYVYNEGNRLFLGGDYQSAEEEYKKIPYGAKEFNKASIDLSAISFLKGDLEDAVSRLKQVIKEQGESVRLCCSLSTMYHYLKNDEKSGYYYTRALSLSPECDEDYLNLVACSIEQGVHENVVRYFEKANVESSSLQLRHLYALALINTNRYAKALEKLKELFVINPNNAITEYYVKLVSRICDGEKEPLKLLPLEYNVGLPSSQEKAIIKRIKSLCKMDYKERNVAFKKKGVLKDILWGIHCAEIELAKECVVLLIERNTPRTDGIISDILMDVSVRGSLKQFIIYLWVVAGYKKKLRVIAGNFYVSIKPRKFYFEMEDFKQNNTDTEFYITAYALALSKLAFTDMEDIEKVYIGTERVYKHLNGRIEKTCSYAEVATLMAICSPIVKDVDSDERLCELFNVDKNKIKLLKKIYGEYNG